MGFEGELVTLLEWVTGEYDNRRQVETVGNLLADAAPDPARARRACCIRCSAASRRRRWGAMSSICNGRKVPPTGRGNASAAGRSR